MDIGNLKPHHAELVILHPGDMKTPLGLTLKLQSLKSPRVQAIIQDHQAELEREINAGADKVNPDLSKRQGIERIAACVVDWEWREAQPAVPARPATETQEAVPAQPAIEATTFNGKVPECTLAEVVSVFTAADEILSQVVTYVRREAHFYKDFLNGS